MLDIQKFKTIGMISARNAREQASAEGTAANHIIDLAPLLAVWKAGVQSAGAIVTYQNYPYKTITSHDSTNNPEWNPEATPSLFAPYHGTDKNHALEWRSPTGAHDAYYIGEWMKYTDGYTYECLVDATVHSPDVLSANWRKEERG